MDRVPIPADLADLSRIFTAHGHSVYLVGGAVRDYFLGKEPGDWDIASDATPKEVMGLFNRVIPTGIDHGTVTINFRGRMIECTTFRTEQGYSDGRRPDEVRYAATIEEDLSRRDFTMNAIAVSLPRGQVVDPFGGRADIASRTIRTVGNPVERFSEDGLRPMRAVRFSALPGFVIADETLEAIRPTLRVTAKVARERIRDELSKLLVSPDPVTGLRCMETTGLMELILPELLACRGVAQGGNHRHDVLDHLYLVCALCPTGSLELRLAGLFHDIGKPVVRLTDGDGQYTFYNHESESAGISEKILDRLRFPVRTMKRVSHLVRQHMFHYESVWTDAAVRRFIVKTGVDDIDDLFALRRADSRAISGINGDPPELPELSDRIRKVLAEKHAFTLKDLAVNGNDLLAAGIPAGPSTGLVLKELLSAVLDDPELNARERLLDIAKAICREHGL